MALADKPHKTVLQLSRQAGRLYVLSLRKQLWLLLLITFLAALNIAVQQNIVNIILGLLLAYFMMVFVQAMGALYQGQAAHLWHRCKSNFMTFLATIFTFIVIIFISLALFLVLALAFAIAGFIVMGIFYLLLGSGSSILYVLEILYGALFIICYIVLFVYINVAFYIAIPLVIIEKRLPFDAISESFRLVKGRRWFLLGSYIYIGFIAFVAYLISLIVMMLIMYHLSINPAAVVHQSGPAWLLVSAPAWLMVNLFVLPLSYALSVVVMRHLLLSEK